MRVFTPRDYQHLAIEHIVQNPRCSLMAKPGMGKSSSTLAALDAIYLSGESTPALIIAPKRVALHTWPNEVKKWQDFSSYETSPILGNEAERLSALRRDVPIYTINYENIQWLLDNLRGKWPFGIVVADESTKLKNVRVSVRNSKDGPYIHAEKGGSGRAGALAKVVFDKRVKRFVELTGTPASNGLKDLWGQIFFLDMGFRLGRCYGAFEDRWFERVMRHPRDKFGELRPRPGAEAEINAKIADLCLALDPKDWFPDLQELLQFRVNVAMPAKARKLYTQMEKEMYIEIAAKGIEAFSASSMTMKCRQLCIAEGTEVLTDAGWKTIETVCLLDKVWDGTEFVSHTGILNNGVREVVVLDGVCMTPDHLVLTTAGWFTAKEIINAESDKRLDRADVRLPYGYPSSEKDKTNGNRGAMGSPVCLRKGSYTPGGGLEIEAERTEEIVRLSPRRNADRCLELARAIQPPSFFGLEGYVGEVYKSARQGLEKLRRAWDNGVRCVANFFFRLPHGYVQWLPKGVDIGPERQLEGVLPRELPVGYREATGQQHPEQRVPRNPERENDTDPSSRSLRPAGSNPARTHLPIQVHGAGCLDDTHPAATYDISNAGPLNRFVVRGFGGELLIVHNCAGAIYLDDTRTAWTETHDEKIQALEDIYEECGGLPLLVAYQFRHDLERLLKAFPKGVDLATTAGLKKFMAGEAQYGFGHPASIGHGFDGMQDITNVIVFFSSDFNLEYREQIIERIGPVRQLQSGHKRKVLVYDIVAEDSIDEVVLARQMAKCSVQEAFFNAMKKKTFV